MRLICLCLLIWSWTARAQSYHIYNTDAAIVNIEYKTIFQTLYKSNSEVPITVRISNRTQDAQKWVAHAKVGWNLDASQIDTTLQVEAGQTRIFTIHFPCRDEYDYYSYYLFFSGPGVDNNYTVSPFGNIADSGKVTTYKAYEMMKKMSEEEQESYRSHSGGSYELGYQLKEVLVDNLPSNWTSYSALRAIYMTASEFFELRESVKVAIRDWLVFGGQLIIYDADEGEQKKIQTFMGTSDAKQPFKQVGVGALGFLKNGALPKLYGADRKGKMQKLASDEQESWLPEYSSGNTNILFFIILLGVFVIILMPINYFFFAKKNKLLLIFTTPAISVAASIIFFVFIILSDGMGGDGARKQYVFINSAAKRAYNMQVQVSKTGLMFNDSFQMDGDFIVDVKKVFVRKKSISKENTFYIKNDGELTGDIFNSRTRRFTQFDEVEATQATVQLITGTENLIRSQFNGVLETLIVGGKKNRLYMGKNVKPGELVQLQEVTVADFAKLPLSKCLPFVRQLGHGYFMADLVGTDDFLIPSHSSIDWEEKPAVAMGTVLEVAK